MVLMIWQTFLMPSNSSNQIVIIKISIGYEPLPNGTLLKRLFFYNHHDGKIFSKGWEEEKDKSEENDVLQYTARHKKCSLLLTHLLPTHARFPHFPFCHRHGAHSARGEIPLTPVFGDAGDGNQQNQQHQSSEEHVDGLTAQPFWDVTANQSLFPWAVPLEEQAHVILVGYNVGEEK
jgi:hypothetical protein